MSLDQAKHTASKYILDIAFVTSLATGFLYICGWAYWRNFFQYFGIGNDFIALDLIRSISTIWINLLPGFLVILLVLLISLSEPNKKESNVDMFLLILASMVIVYLLIINIFTFEYVYGKYPKAFYLFGGSLLILAIMEKHITAHSRFLSKAVQLDKLYKSKQDFLLYVVVFVLLLLAICSFMGAVHGELRTISEDRIIIQTNDGWQTPKGTILITHMDNKYFLYNSSSGNSTAEVFIIDDTQVKKAILLNDNSKSSYFKKILTHFDFT